MEESNMKSFLDNTFVFRKVGLFEIFNPGKSPIYWNYKSKITIAEFDNNVEPCQLIDDNLFDDWHIFKKDSINFFIEEYKLSFLKSTSNIKVKDSELKKVILDLICNYLVKTIFFNKDFQKVISNGRYKVKGIKPLTLEERENIAVEEGKFYYVCTSNDKFNIVNPCYVLKREKVTPHFPIRIIYFTDVKDAYTCGSKIEINGWGFATVGANEVGMTPHQAMQNKQI